MKRVIIMSLVIAFALVQWSVAKEDQVLKPVYTAPESWQAKVVPYEYEGAVAGTLGFFDFESGDQGFQAIDGSAQESYWHADEFNAYGGSGSSYWCAQAEYGGYDNTWYQWMDTPTIDLREAGPPILMTFRHYKDFEAESEETNIGWDAANVRISTDNGNTFEVLDPSFPPYDADSCAAWHLFREAPLGGYPGWGGEEDLWMPVEFDLSAYTGRQVILRFVFGSDWSYSTRNSYNSPSQWNPDFYVPQPQATGYFVDEVRVEDTGGVLFFDDAGDTGPVQMTMGSRDVGDFGFVLTTEDAHSPTHSWNFDNDELDIGGFSQEQNNSYLYWIESPFIELPEGEYPELTFWARCHMPDGDGNNDNTLEDNFDCYVYSEEDDSWTKLFHDYWRETINVGEVWTLWDDNFIYNGTMKLDRWSGQRIKIAWNVQADDDDDGGNGTGLWVDDVLVFSRAAPDNDIGIEFVGCEFPHSIGYGSDVIGKIRNYGLLDKPIAIVYYFAEDLDGNKVLSDQPTGPPWPSIPSGDTLDWQFDFVPQDTGYHRIGFYQFTPDQFPPNDSNFSSYFWVYPEKEGFIAHMYGLSESGYNGEAGEGPAVRYDPPEDLGQYNIVTIELDLSRTGGFKCYIYEASGIEDTIPDDGELLYETSVYEVSEHSGSNYYGFDVSTVEALQERTGSFFVFYELQEGNDLGWSGATSPLPPSNYFRKYDEDEDGVPEWHYEDDVDIRARCYIQWGVTGACEGTRGDVTGDGNVNVLDILAIANHILGINILTGDALCRADCTGDGVVNILDALAVANVILGLLPACPGGGACKPEVTPEVIELMESLRSYLPESAFAEIMALVKGEVGVPAEYSLAQNYPNPFNPVTSIRYTVAGDVRTELTVYNVLGQEVVTLVDGVKAPGAYTVEWDASDLASGVYFYRLTAGDYTATRRMVLMK
jgi:hypothetical protein